MLLPLTRSAGLSLGDRACLALARCQYVLKCMSQLSAFSKIFNPSLELYRVSACKVNWFPEAYVPLYRSENERVRNLLRGAQKGNYDFSFAGTARRRIGKLTRKVARIPAECWGHRSGG